MMLFELPSGLFGENLLCGLLFGSSLHLIFTKKPRSSCWNYLQTCSDILLLGHMYLCLNIGLVWPVYLYGYFQNIACIGQYKNLVFLNLRTFLREQRIFKMWVKHSYYNGNAGDIQRQCAHSNIILMQCFSSDFKLLNHFQSHT